MESEIPNSISIGIIEDDLKFQEHLASELTKLTFKLEVKKFSSQNEFFSNSEIQSNLLGFGTSG